MKRVEIEQLGRDPETVAVCDRAEAALHRDKRLFYVDPDGVLYVLAEAKERASTLPQSNGLYKPFANEWVVNYYRFRFHGKQHIDSSHNWLCKCLNSSFEVFNGEDGIWLRCTKCGHETIAATP